MRSLAFVLHVCVLTVIGSTALAAAPMPAGKKALLSLNIQIDGAGQRASKSDGVDVKWSTHRMLEAKVELVAAKAEGQSDASIKDQIAAAATYQQSAAMAALQKEAAKCKPNDTACQMEIAMKMMDTDEGQKMMQQSDAANDAPPRYQHWTVPSKGRIEVKAEYQEQWDGVFLTASREVRNCKIALSPAATGAGALTTKDLDTLKEGLKGLDLEIDTRTGKNSLLLAVGSYAAGELKCHINDGGRIEDEHENKAMTFKPPIDLDATGGWVEGRVAAGPAIARGELNVDTKPEAHSLTGMMSVTAPLKVKIRWELNPL